MRKEEPFYKIDEECKTDIMELIKACKKTGLGNVSFDYQITKPSFYEVHFYLTERNGGSWNLVVKFEKKDNTGTFWAYTDIYIVEADDQIEYDYSEYDLV